MKHEDQPIPPEPMPPDLSALLVRDLPLREHLAEYVVNLMREGVAAVHGLGDMPHAKAAAQRLRIDACVSRPGWVLGDVEAKAPRWAVLATLADAPHDAHDAATLVAAAASQDRMRLVWARVHMDAKGRGLVAAEPDELDEDRAQRAEAVAVRIIPDPAGGDPLAVHEAGHAALALILHAVQVVRTLAEQLELESSYRGTP